MKEQIKEIADIEDDQLQIKRFYESFSLRDLLGAYMEILSAIEGEQTSISKLFEKYNKEWEKYGMGAACSYSQIVSDLGDIVEDNLAKEALNQPQEQEKVSALGVTADEAVRNMTNNLKAMQGDKPTQEAGVTLESLEKECEESGYTAWINADIYPNGRIHTREFVKFLVNKLKNQPSISDDEIVKEAFKAGYIAYRKHACEVKFDEAAQLTVDIEFKEWLTTQNK